MIHATACSGSKTVIPNCLAICLQVRMRAALKRSLETSPYYTPSDVSEPKSSGWLSITLMRRPLRLP